MLVVTCAIVRSKPFFNQIVEEYYPAFAALVAEQGKKLPQALTVNGSIW